VIRTTTKEDILDYSGKLPATVLPVLCGPAGGVNSPPHPFHHGLDGGSRRREPNILNLVLTDFGHCTQKIAEKLIEKRPTYGTMKTTVNRIPRMPIDEHVYAHDTKSTAK
jgi:hypothetical protein